MKRGSYPPVKAIAATHKSGIATGEGQVCGRLGALADKTGLNRQDTGQDGARHIANRSPPKIGPGPGGGILSGTQGVISRNVTSNGRLLSHLYPPRPDRLSVSARRW